MIEAALGKFCHLAKGYTLLSSHTKGPTSDSYLKNDTTGAFDDLLQRNASSLPLPHDLACPTGRLVDHADIDRFFYSLPEGHKGRPADWGWPGIERAYPESKGWMTVSLPGYSPDGNTAVIYTALGCGMLCGSGGYVYLVRNGGRWEIKDRVHIWSS